MTDFEAEIGSLRPGPVLMRGALVRRFPKSAYKSTNNATVQRLLSKIRRSVDPTFDTLAQDQAGAAPRPARPKSMLVFDPAYSLRSLTATGNLDFVIQRDLNGFFDRVITIQPLLGADPLDALPAFTGRRRKTQITERHLFVENKAFASHRLHGLPHVNFLASQAEMLAFACRTVVDEDIDVIRAVDPFVTGAYALAVSRVTRRPFTLRIGANYDALAERDAIVFRRLLPSYRLQRAIARIVLSRCHLVLTANRNYQNYAIANGARPDRTVVVPYGGVIDGVHFSPPASRGDLPAGLPWSGRPFGIVVGRLIDLKFPRDIIEVARRVRARIPGVAVVFVGDGELREDLAAAADQAGLADTCYFVGTKNQEWLARVYPHAAACLSPLTGRALAEAALAGIPLVAYDCDWHGEIVESGVTGELVPFRDISAMAEAFARLVSEREYGKALGSRARERALDLMDRERIQAVERRAYQRILSKTHREMEETP